jgi:DNA modification methylase
VDSLLLQITHVSIDSLTPYSNNSRKHSESQVESICNSIKEFGFTNPILIDETNGIIAGHGRLMAARKLNLTSVPCIMLKGLTPNQKKAYVIADNKLALNAEWDMAMLISEVNYLEEQGFKTELMGFSLDELENMKPEKFTQGLCDEDEVPAPLVEPVTKMGDLWILGNHRLLCGDSTEVTIVDRLLGEYKPILMVTDPPYGVNYDPEWRDRDNVGLGVGERSKGKVDNDDKVDWTAAYSLFTGDIVYVWHAGLHSGDIAAHLKNCGFNLISQIVWAKQHFAISRGDYHWQHEPCWYAVRNGKKHNWQGARDQSTIWNIKNNNSFGNSKPEETWGHGTQKPIDCMARPIENNSAVGDYIYDPFGGSGTTLIACEKLARNCLMLEISPIYCDTIVARWEKFTGLKAILEQTQ